MSGTQHVREYVFLQYDEVKMLKGFMARVNLGAIKIIRDTFLTPPPVTFSISKIAVFQTYRQRSFKNIILL